MVLFQWQKCVGQSQLVSPKESHSLSLRGGRPLSPGASCQRGTKPTSGGCSRRVETYQTPRRLQPVGETQPSSLRSHIPALRGPKAGFYKPRSENFLVGCFQPRVGESSHGQRPVEAVKFFFTSQEGSSGPRRCKAPVLWVSSGASIAAGHLLPLPRGLLHTTRGRSLHTGWRGPDKAGGCGALGGWSAPRAKRGLEPRYSRTVPRRPQHSPGWSWREAERVSEGRK